jgi:hypothetical protein
MALVVTGKQTAQSAADAVALEDTVTAASTFDRTNRPDEIVSTNFFGVVVVSNQPAEVAMTDRLDLKWCSDGRSRKGVRDRARTRRVEIATSAWRGGPGEAVLMPALSRVRSARRFTVSARRTVVELRSDLDDEVTSWCVDRTGAPFRSGGQRRERRGSASTLAVLGEGDGRRKRPAAACQIV